MAVRVAVSDPLPRFRRGIIQTLRDAGYEVDSPPDLMAWAPASARSVVFLTLSSGAEWALLRQIHQAGRASTIAVVNDLSATTYARALQEGAGAAIERAAEPEALIAVLEAVVRGYALLPIEVVRVLTTMARTPIPVTAGLPDRERDWLRRLAAGATVRDLAEHAGYSEP
ncbi:MAG TPA: hypothetical protein VFC19_32760 [Candidatus Limnocylindrales bacterium]|nr:hypothetical protein [Candidatus Limnocylindrales bacterium]